MVYFGVDPSLNNTGIVIFKDKDGENEPVLWGSLTISHVTKKATKRRGGHAEGTFVASFEHKPKLPKDVNLSDYGWPYRLVYPMEHNVQIRQIIAFYKLCSIVFRALSQMLADENDKVLRHGAFGIEIPFGHHKGAAAKVDRIFASIVLAIHQAAPPLASLGHWDMYEFNPQELKKFVAGKAGVSKDVILKEVFKRWGFDTNVNDVADAYGLGRLLWHNLNGGV